MGKPADPAFVLWTRGLRGPEVAVLHNRGSSPALSEGEKARALAAPTRIDPGDEALPLAAIERLYPLLPEAGRGRPA